MVLFLFQYPPLKSWLTLYIRWGHNSNVQWVPRCSENKLELWKSEIQCDSYQLFGNGLTVYQLWLAFTKVPKCLTKQLKYSLQLGNPSFLKEILCLFKLTHLGLIFKKRYASGLPYAAVFEKVYVKVTMYYIGSGNG